MFGTGPDQIQRRVSQWAQQFADRAQRFETMRAQVEQISVSESAAANITDTAEDYAAADEGTALALHRMRGTR